MTTLPACSKFTVILLADHRLDLSEAPVGAVGVAHQHAWLEEFVHRRPARRPAAREGAHERDMPDLSALVSARLCHDLISPMGAIGNGLELLQLFGRPGRGRARPRQREPGDGARQAPLLPRRLRAGRRAGAPVVRRGDPDLGRDVPRALHRLVARARRRPAADADRGRSTSRSSASRRACRWAGRSGSGSRARRSRSRSTDGAPRRRRRCGRTSSRARRCRS